MKSFITQVIVVSPHELMDTAPMRRLVHISDLHFGRIRPELLQILKNEIMKAEPDLLIISGDLTQRARPSEFEAAHQFLHSLPFRKLVVPGNHDVPLFNVFLRLLNPLARYSQYITNDLSPSYEDDEISVQGITTAHGRTLTGGRFDEKELQKIIDHWEKLPRNVLRILVSHHPFEILTTRQRIRRLGHRIKLPLQLELPNHADLILSGHYHRGGAAPTEQVYLTPQRSIVAIEAGTAFSSRLREEPNSYNFLLVKNGEICFEKRTWSDQENAFLPEKAKRFFNHPRFGADWEKVPEKHKGPPEQTLLTDF